MTTLSQINADYNNNIKNLNNQYNAQLRTASRMNIINRRNFTRQILSNYTTNLTTLNKQRKTDIKRIGKFIHTSLIVGINYNNTVNQLRGCINDANNMKQFVSVRGCENILMMTDVGPIRPTKNNILLGIARLLEMTQNNEVAFFYYSGHGTNVTDSNKDELDCLDECLLSVDNRVIIDDEINVVIKQYLKPTTKLFIMCDSCHSGTVIDLKYNYTENEDMVINGTEINGNVFYISGCKDAEVSMESFLNNQIRGALTNAFMNTLTDETTWGEFMKNIQSKLPGQSPQLSCSQEIDIETDKCFF